MRDAHSVAGLTPDNFVPVSIVPRASHSACCCGCCSCCWTSIPSGFSAIVSAWGRDVDGAEDDGTWDPGFHWMCPWHRVSRLVSRQLVIFDTPVKAVKTQDNVPVQLDVLIVFEIVKATDFIYNIGPEKFDDLLRSSQEEVPEACTALRRALPARLSAFSCWAACSTSGLLWEIVLHPSSLGL
ncbi:unnamed protein product, partial [Prorocentrum cordatum]